MRGFGSSLCQTVLRHVLANENDALPDPCVSLKRPALDLPYLCLLCFWNLLSDLYIACFHSYGLMDDTMGLLTRLTFCTLCSVCFTGLNTLNTFRFFQLYGLSRCKPFSSRYSVKKEEEMDCVRVSLAFPQRSLIVHGRIRSSSLRS